MKISFILVEPAVAENIGASARALNTMGFDDLRLVNPTDHLSDKARWLAHGSINILENANKFLRFDEAIADLDFTIGTTAKKRSARNDYYTPEEAKEILLKKKKVISRVGIVFGREESGLTNEELARCDVASTIPIRNPYPSLNLAQSVMLYAYIFSNIQTGTPPRKLTKQKKGSLYRELMVTTNSILHQLNIDHNPVLYHRMLERLATADEDDVRLFLSFAKNFNRKFE